MLRDFVPEETVEIDNNTAFIGSIGGKAAIVLILKQSYSLSTLEDLKKATYVVEQQNDVYTTLTVPIEHPMFVRLIYPAQEEHLMKLKSRYKYRPETADEYHRSKKEYLRDNWITNLLNSSTNVSEDILYADEDIVVVYNYNWDKKLASKLYILAIFKDRNLRTLRDIKDIGLLMRVKRNVLNVVHSFGLDEEDVAMFFHYKPSYYQLHLHVLNINVCNTATASVLRAVLLNDMIYNLSLDKNYYDRQLWIMEKKS